MTKCKECGQEISSKALACPKCGAARPKPWGLGKMIVGGFIVIVAASFIVGVAQQDPAPSPQPKTPEQIAQEKKEREQNLADLMRVRALRAAMKNPDSFKLISALRMADGTLCVEYQAANSFNATVGEYKAIAKDGRFVDWNSRCGGKTGENMTAYIRMVL